MNSKNKNFINYLPHNFWSNREINYTQLLKEDGIIPSSFEKRKKSSFGKKTKKPSAALKKMCKKLKVRLTMKRGGKKSVQISKSTQTTVRKSFKKRKKKIWSS